MAVMMMIGNWLCSGCGNYKNFKTDGFSDSSHTVNRLLPQAQF